MRTELGQAAVDVLLLLAGFGVLNAFGLVRPTFRGVAGATGLAFLTGLSAVMLIGIVLLVLGSAFRLPLFVGVSLVVAAAGLLARREWFRSIRRPTISLAQLRSDFRAADVQVKLAVFALVGFAIYAAFGFAVAGVKPMTEWDAWSLWARKGIALFYNGSLPLEMFTRSVYVFQHPDYPLLLPLFESVQYRAMGGLNTWAIHAQFWLFLVAFVWSLLYLGHRRGAFVAWTPIAIAVGVVPGVYGQLLTGYADLPMALLLALGVLMLAEWLRTDERGILALAVLFLAAAANVKNEGLVASAITMVVAGAILVFTRRWSRLKVFAVGGAGYLAGVLPWRLWVAAHHIYHDVPLLKGIEPSYLAGRLDRVWPSVKAMYAQLIDQSTWIYIVPFAAAIVIASFLAGRRREQAVFFFVTGVGFFLAFVWTSWVAAVDPLNVFLSQSAYRIVASIAAISLAAVLDLSAPIPGEASDLRSRLLAPKAEDAQEEAREHRLEPAGD